MIKYLICILSLTTLVGLAQIPNSDFESWVNVSSYENPEYWFTNNGATTTVQKTSDSFSGMYAINIESNYPSIEGKAPGEAYTFVSPLSSSDTLYAWVKCDSLISPAKGVIEIVAYNSGQNPQVINRLEIAQASPNYQLMSMVIPNVTADSLGIWLVAESFQSALGYEGYVRMKVDKLHVSSSLGITQNELHIKVYPNPTRGIVNFDFPENNFDGMVLNGQGSPILRLSENGQYFDLSQFPSGIYFLKISTESGVAIRKIIKLD